jgi:hypothetical protein
MKMARRNKMEMAAARALESRIVAVLSRTDNLGRQAVGRALGLLLDRQTTDEKRDHETRHSNDRGFTQGDAVKGQKHAEYFNAHGTLTDFQFNYWTRIRIRDLNGYITGFGDAANHIVKYRGQLMDEAELKRAREAA